MALRRIAFVLASVMALGFLVVPRTASAGPYGDALGKCLVDSTTPDEKTGLVRWIFAMMSLHPDVEAGSTITPQQRTAMAKETAKLFQRLLTEACAPQAREAIRYEGPAAIQNSFSLLGQVAASELFSDPKVAAGLAEFAKYIDEKKLKQLNAPGPIKSGSTDAKE
jgi:hypothetical protein